jgi:Ras-related GTP-binding protein C/D
MQPHRRRPSATSQHSFHGEARFEQDEASHAGAARLKPGAQLTLMRYLQDLPDAESVPPSDLQPRYHTGRVPNSKAGDGKPRLLLMGQRRCVPAILRVVPFPSLTVRTCRSGKSSISSVVFHKLPPSETLYLETTTRIKKESMQYVGINFVAWRWAN